MNILKVWDGEYPWDVRTEKVCRALTSRGHSVHMVARNRDGRVLREKLTAFVSPAGLPDSPHGPSTGAP